MIKYLRHVFQQVTILDIFQEQNHTDSKYLDNNNYN